MICCIWFLFHVLFNNRTVFEPANDLLFDFGPHADMATISILDNDSNLGWVCFRYVYKYFSTLKAIVKIKISVACGSLPTLVDSNGQSGPRLKRKKKLNMIDR